MGTDVDRAVAEPAGWPETIEPLPLPLVDTGWVAARRSALPTLAADQAPLALLARRPAPTVLTGEQTATGAPIVARGPLSFARRDQAAGTPPDMELTGSPTSPPAAMTAEFVGPAAAWPAAAWPALAAEPSSPTSAPLPLIQSLPMTAARASDPRRLAAERLEQSSGAPLPLPVRAPFERLFRTSFAEVAIDTDAPAAEATAAVGAAALTLGPRIFFAPGRFRPEEPEGGSLLAHELTHVVQQRVSPVRMALKRADSVAAPPEAVDSEREADATESRVRELYSSGNFAAQPLTLARAVAPSAGQPPTDGSSFLGADYDGGAALGSDGSPALARIVSTSYASDHPGVVNRAVTIDEMQVGAEGDAAGKDGAGGEADVKKIAKQVYEILKDRLMSERERRGRWL